MNCVWRPVESENSPRTETEDAVTSGLQSPTAARHDNLDKDDVVNEHAQLSPPPPTTHQLHMPDPSPPPEHTLAASTQTTGTPDPCNRPHSRKGSTSVSSWSGPTNQKLQLTGYVVRAFQLGPPPTSKLTRRFLFPNRIRRAQEHILDLFPDMLQGIASSHPVLCHAPEVFRYDVRRLQIIHIKASVSS